MTMNATEKQAVKDLKETIDRLSKLLLKADTQANKYQKQIDDLNDGLVPREQLNKALVAAIGWMNCQNGLDYLGREIVAVGLEAEDASARLKDHDNA